MCGGGHVCAVCMFHGMGTSRGIMGGKRNTLTFVSSILTRCSKPLVLCQVNHIDYISICVCARVYLLIPPDGKDVIQAQFLSGI